MMNLLLENCQPLIGIKKGNFNGTEELYTEKDELKENFLRLQVIAESLDLKNLKEDLAKNIILLNHESFELVVVGEFSRGKSTFINAMLGSRILPASKNQQLLLSVKLYMVIHQNIV